MIEYRSLYQIRCYTTTIDPFNSFVSTEISTHCYILWMTTFRGLHWGRTPQFWIKSRGVWNNHLSQSLSTIQPDQLDNPKRKGGGSRMAAMLIQFGFKSTPGWFLGHWKKKRTNGTQSGQTKQVDSVFTSLMLGAHTQLTSSFSQCLMSNFWYKDVTILLPPSFCCCLHLQIKKKMH